MPDTAFHPRSFSTLSGCITGFPSATEMLRICSLNVVLMFYMDASRWQGLIWCSGTGRLQFYIRPICAGLSPAGPDGICRPAPHFLRGLLALYINSGLAGRGLTCLPSHFVVPCATFQRATSFVVRVSNRQPRLSGLADEVRLVRPVMGQQGPDCACRLVGQRDGGHVRRPPLGQAQRPFGWSLATR